MDCRTARHLLDYARPHPPELEAGEREALESHLADCPECASLARAERRVDHHIARAMQAVSVPPGLHQYLLETLAAQGRPWHRHRMVRAAAVLAAAAAALLLWLGLEGNGKPQRVDTEQAWHLAMQQRGSPPPQVEEWFYETHKIRISAPPQFDYNCLAFYDLSSFQNKRVPLLIFQKGGEWARVYILSDSQFKLKGVDNPLGYTIRFLPHPTNPHLGYVVIYTSEKLDTFLNDEQRPAT